MNLQAIIDEDTRLQLIAEQLDLDYEDLKAKQPDDLDMYEQAINAPITVPGGEGDVIEE